MDEVRRDATGGEGAFVVQRVHCDGELLLDGGPCLCGPGGCVLVLLPCCSCPGALAFIRDTPQVQAIWPFESRGDGRVVRMGDGRCYRFVATIPEIPPAATREYVFDNIVGFVDSCGDPSCAGAACDQLPGGVIELGSPCSIQTQLFDCVESFGYRYSESGYGSLELDPDNPFYAYEIRAGSAFDGSWSLSDGGRGTWDVYTRGTREADSNGNDRVWDYRETYEADTAPVGLVSPQPGASAFVQDPFALPPEVWSLRTEGVGQNPGNTGHNATIDGATYCQQGIRREVSVSGGGVTTTRTSIVHVRTTALGRGVYAFWSEHAVASDGTTLRRTYNRLSRRFSYTRVRFSNGIEINGLDTEDACEIPSTVIAYRCDAEDPSDPEVRIVVDLAEVPDPGSLQYRAWYEGDLYIVTGEPAEGPAAEVVWTLDQCPEPPDPTGDIYQVNVCRRNQPATGIELAQNGQLVPRTIGYRPGDGLAPGEGFVLYLDRIGQNECLYLVAGQPTTIVLDEEPDIVLTSYAGQSCRNIPARLQDPRPGCQETDAGGGVGPSDINLTAPPPPATDPRLNAFAEGQIGQQFNCSSCG